VVRGDDPDAALRVHGVVSHDGREAIFAVVQLTTSVVAPPGRVLLPGLVDHLEYDVRPMPPGDDPGPGAGASLPAWWSSGAHLTGRVLGVVGIQVPNQNPEHAVLLHAQAR
jgi:alpha-galactosidase